MITATARVHGLTVATPNKGDFRYLGVAVINPFKSKPDQPGVPEKEFTWMPNHFGTLP